MYETDAEVAALQQLLDESHSRSTEHLRNIIRGERVLSAADLVALLTGMKVLSLATVTSGGEPRISAVDGHFLHATWSFSTARDAAKARQIRRRAQVSVAHIDHEDLGVFSHGHVSELSRDDADFDEIHGHWSRHYGGSPYDWGDVTIYRYHPSWMVAYAFDRSALLAARGIDLAE